MTGPPLNPQAVLGACACVRRASRQNQTTLTRYPQAHTRKARAHHPPHYIPRCDTSGEGSPSSWDTCLSARRASLPGRAGPAFASWAPCVSRDEPSGTIHQIKLNPRHTTSYALHWLRASMTLIVTQRLSFFCRSTAMIACTLSNNRNAFQYSIHQEMLTV